MMMTVEEYLAVGYVWQAGKEEGYNPFDHEFADLQNQINFNNDGQVAEDGWVDYADNINTIEKEEEVERHQEKFDPYAQDSQDGD